mmetsp:Transcript_53902/g.161284  ORF Transcript_53902/g.161284 Transcript_53902/m.161284 type:complete len:205 (-) Transcript_53902:84-698(-)
MAEVGLNLDLPAELMLDSRLDELGLLEDLEGDDVLGPFFPGEVDGAEFSPAEGLAYLEVVEDPLTSLTGGGGLGLVVDRLMARRRVRRGGAGVLLLDEGDALRRTDAEGALESPAALGARRRGGVLLIFESRSVRHRRGDLSKPKNEFCQFQETCSIFSIGRRRRFWCALCSLAGVSVVPLRCPIPEKRQSPTSRLSRRRRWWN